MMLAGIVRRFLCACALVLAATPLSAASPGQGSDNPVLAFNVAPAVDWVPGMQFLDLMKTGRPWRGHGQKKRGLMSVEDLRAGGYLDDQGWVKAIPQGLKAVGTHFGWSSDAGMRHYRQGRYLIRYRGTGKLVLGGDARVVSSAPGQILFENRKGKGWQLNIQSTDPAGSGDYIRDISIVAERHLDLHAVGAVFNPDWLLLLRDARVLRFMEWTLTNHPPQLSWDERPQVNEPFTGRGHPLEYMVQLANEVGADPWFTMPHLADDDFIRRFSEYVRDNLDPRLVARVEWSNEIWNWSFPQTRWTQDRSKAEWGVVAPRDYAAKRAVESALIWQDVFKDNPQRLRKVLGSHAARKVFSEGLLRAKLWRENEPENFVPPAQVFDELAVATYFGNGLVRSPEGRARLLRAIRDPNVDTNAYLAELLMDPEFNRSLPSIAKVLAEQKAVAEANGLKLVSYEGGQHVHHSMKRKAKGAEKETSKEDLQSIQDTLADFVESPEMGQLYKELWDIWARLGDGPFMQYSDITRTGKFGSWGLYRSLVEDSPRGAVLRELGRTQTPWWPTQPGAQYQHGLVKAGTDQADSLVGTVEEDYLLGRAGNDTFVPGTGRDGIHGGLGRDRVVYEGASTLYKIREERSLIPGSETTYLTVEGPNTLDRLVGIEELAFDDGIIQFTQQAGQ